ncbi:MAG: hypothetical protein Q6353_000630, partial [Candidatus Sigynarchaeum springense]
DGRWLVTSAAEGARLYDVTAGVPDGSGEWGAVGIIGYDWRREPECTWSPLTTGAAFLGATSIVAIAHEGELIECIDIRDVLDARGNLENPGKPGDVKPKLVVPGSGRSEGVLATSPDGRWIATGGRRGFVVIDVDRFFDRS